MEANPGIHSNQGCGILVRYAIVDRRQPSGHVADFQLGLHHGIEAAQNIAGVVVLLMDLGNSVFAIPVLVPCRLGCPDAHRIAVECDRREQDSPWNSLTPSERFLTRTAPIR